MSWDRAALARIEPSQRRLILLQEKLKREKARLNSKNWQVSLLESLFPDQLAFVLSDAKAIAAQCTRRAGKTHGAAAKLIRAAAKHQGSTALYLALTRKSAKRLLWPKLRQMKRQYGVPLTFNETDLTATLPNGSQILLYGADQENMAERLRGDAYSIVLVDEAASFSESLEYVMTDVVEPALMDFDGSLCMIGSPGVVLAGPFFDATTDQSRGWELHKWSVLDNFHLPHARKWISELKKRRGWDDDNPTYLREYCNVWTEDPEALIYRFSPGKNEYSDLPHGHDWQYVLGLDIGFEDPSAWGVVAFADTHPKAYIVHSESHHGLTVTDVAQVTHNLQKQYRPFATVGDAGALGKMIIEEINTRYGLAIEAAQKTDKLAHIEMMNSDFRSERLLVHDSLTGLKHQYRTLTKDRSGLKEDPTLPNDLCDSTLYPWRYCRNYWYKEKIVEPEYGTEDYWKRIEERQIETILAQSQSQNHWFDELQ